MQGIVVLAQNVKHNIQNNLIPVGAGEYQVDIAKNLYVVLTLHAVDG